MMKYLTLTQHEKSLLEKIKINEKVDTVEYKKIMKKINYLNYYDNLHRKKITKDIIS